ncbi:MAG: hypothetical protein HRT87_09345 [Legionellales bacterium]|nr:hypothetical protein [Legionellales bacterium]
MKKVFLILLLFIGTVNAEHSTIFDVVGDCQNLSRSGYFVAGMGKIITFNYPCLYQDCKALVNNNDKLCTTKDCKALVHKNSSMCESDMCRAVLDLDTRLCGNNTNCKALVTATPGMCKLQVGCCKKQCACCLNLDGSCNRSRCCKIGCCLTSCCCGIGALSLFPLWPSIGKFVSSLF